MPSSCRVSQPLPRRLPCAPHHSREIIKRILPSTVTECSAVRSREAPAVRAVWRLTVGTALQ